VKFAIEQRFAAPADEVARAFADPALYAAMVGMPKLTQPEVLHHDVEGDIVHLQVRFRFGGELAPAARAVIDPNRLTWVEHATHDLATHTARFTMQADHYHDRFRCSGAYRFERVDDSSCRRTGEADLKVKALLVGSAVEGAIVSGLKEHLVDEVPVVEAFLRDRGADR
jgi:hypothetical protein